MIQFLLNPVTATIGFIMSLALFWFAMFSRFSYLVAKFFNFFLPCVQPVGESVACQTSWNIHVGMTALVVGIIFLIILIRWAIITFGRMFLATVIGVLVMAFLIAVLAYYYKIGKLRIQSVSGGFEVELIDQVEQDRQVARLA